MKIIVSKVSKISCSVAAVLISATLDAAPRDANRNDGAVMKLQTMVRSLSAERDALKAEKDGLVAELERLKKEKADVAAERDALSVELATQKHTVSALQTRLGNTETRLQNVSEKYSQTSHAKTELEQSLTRLTSDKQKTDQQLKTCVEHNVKLYESAKELLERYENKGTLSGLLQDEPLLGFQSVEMQNVVQEYQDRLEAGRFKEMRADVAE